MQRLGHAILQLKISLKIQEKNLGSDHVDDDDDEISFIKQFF